MNDEIITYFAEKVPAAWFKGTPKVEWDDDEILCIGSLPEGKSPQQFREDTRDERIAIASEAEPRFGRKVSWGVESEGATTVFTSLSTPVMTRLRLKERAVLGTLVEGGVARSTSDALAWCVKLVGQHESDWIAELREALTDVKHVRAEGPTLV